MGGEQISHQVFFPGLPYMDRSGLRNEFQVLHLIYYKNFRQHHSQRWWKYLRILHRRVKQLVDKFDAKICTYLVKNVIPPAYRYFQGILAQGAFITLGFALLASLAKIWSLLEPHAVHAVLHAPLKPTVAIAAEDVGEVVARSDIDEDNDFKQKPVQTAKKSGKKKSKRKRDAIDDIFG